jgi:hypothetical protein
MNLAVLIVFASLFSLTDVNGVPSRLCLICFKGKVTAESRVEFHHSNSSKTVLFHNGLFYMLHDDMQIVSVDRTLGQS